MSDEFQPLVTIEERRGGALKVVSAKDAIESFRTGSHRPLVEKIRATYARVLAETGDMKLAKEAVSGDKRKLPGVMWSGVFSKRGNKNCETYSQLLCADIDELGADRVPGVMGQLVNDPHCIVAAISPTATGVKALYRTTGTADTHRANWAAMVAHVKGAHGLDVDASCKNIERLCFSSDGASHWNDDAVPLEPLAGDTRKERLTESGSPPAPAPRIGCDGMTRKGIAERILGRIDWLDDTTGHCTCPGAGLHTTGDKPTDCKVWLNGAPYLECWHDHCAGIRAGVNHQLQSEIGLAENKSGTLTLNGKPLGQGTPAQAKPAEKDEEKNDRIRAMLKLRRFSFLKPIPPVTAVFSLGGVDISTPANLTAITAQIKAGKSSLLAAMMASAMTNDPEADCLGVKSSNPDGKAIIHIDTEQAPQDWDALIRQATRRARIESAPDWLVSYTLTGCTLPDARAALPIILEDEAKVHGGIHSVMIDGVADLVPSVNDEEESLAFVANLHGLAIQYFCPIIGAIHFNPNSDKTRGHLGSQLERKAETNLKMDKDADEVVTVYSLKSRRAPITKQEGPRFKWDGLAGMHVSVEPGGKAKADEERESMLIHAGAAFERAGKSCLGFCDLIRELRPVCALSDSGARKRFEKMIRARVVTKNIVGRYELTK